MTRTPVARVVLRRRAVVAGRAVDAAGTPCIGASTLVLREATGDAPRERACHMRRDGSFFFLDVPPGRHALNRIDAAGAIEHSIKVVVPNAGPDARLPLVSVELEPHEAAKANLTPPNRKGS
jgi:hypothetical protein